MSDKQSNNKRIAKNTLALYFRTFITMIVGLYTGRVMLQALGVDNYGINNVVGGIIGMSSIITGAMGGSINRFLTYSLGKDDVERTRTVFSTLLTAQLIIIVIAFVVLEVLGVWFLNTQANIPEGRMLAANWVLQCAIVSLVIGLFNAPFSALIVAHERMGIYAYTSIVDVVLRLIVVFCIVAYEGDRLILHSVLCTFVSFGNAIFYNWYTRRNFRESKYRIRLFDRQLFKEVLSFSGWNLGGTSAWIFGTQGVNMLINVFFGVTFNAARGIAVTVNSAIQGFIGNFTVAFTPQITKSYSSGNIEYASTLSNRGTKFTWLLMLIFIVPVCIEADMLLKLWLVNPPEWSSVFLRFAMFESLSVQVSQTLLVLILATGRVRNYFINVIFWAGSVFPLTWISYYCGAPVWASYVIFIFVYCSITLLRLYFLKKLVGYSITKFIINTLFPCCITTVLSFSLPLVLSYYLEEGIFRFFLISSVAVMWTILCTTIFGLSKEERAFFIGKAILFINRIFKKMNPKFIKLRYILYVVFTISISINILFFASDVYYDFKIRQLELNNNIPSEPYDSIEEFQNHLFEGCMEFLNSNVTEIPQPKQDIRQIICENFKGYDENHALKHYGNGYILVACADYAISRGDNQKIVQLSKILSDKISNSSGFTVNQALYGLAACKLYPHTKEPFLIQYADSLYNWLITQETPFGIPYSGKHIQLVDGMGMYNPFFIEYAKITKNTTPYNDAVRQIELFTKYGVDHETGVPSHGFRLQEPYIKVGSANWGRGCGWYALGLLGINESDLSDSTRIVVDKFKNSLTLLYKENKDFTQFIGAPGHLDISATLPIIYYLQQNGCIALKSQDLLDYSRYCKNNILQNSSGDTERDNFYNRYFGPYAVSQAMMLILCNNNENAK